MSQIRRILLLGVAFAASSAWASTIVPASGSITLTGILDSSLNFLGIDVRGTAGFMINSQPVVLTDIFSSASFGNTTLVAMDIPYDGNAVQVTLDPTSLVLTAAPGLTATGTGALLAGSSSSAAGLSLAPWGLTSASRAHSRRGTTSLRSSR